MIPETNSGFEWSESGIVLLQNIQKEIDDIGGRVKMAYIIMKENRSSFTKLQHSIINNQLYKQIYKERKKEERRKNYPRNPNYNLWKREEVDFLLVHFGYRKISKLSHYLGRTPVAIRLLMRRVLGKENYNKRMESCIIERRRGLIPPIDKDDILNLYKVTGRL